MVQAHVIRVPEPTAAKVQQPSIVFAINFIGPLTSVSSYENEVGASTVSNAAEVAPRHRVYLRSDLNRQRADIESRVKAYLARNLYGAEQWYPIAIPTDQTFREAMRLWDRASSLMAEVRR